MTLSCGVSDGVSGTRNFSAGDKNYCSGVLRRFMAAKDTLLQKACLHDRIDESLPEAGMFASAGRLNRGNAIRSLYELSVLKILCQEITTHSVNCGRLVADCG